MSQLKTGPFHTDILLKSTQKCIGYILFIELDRFLPLTPSTVKMLCELFTLPHHSQKQVQGYYFLSAHTPVALDHRVVFQYILEI